MDWLDKLPPWLIAVVFVLSGGGIHKLYDIYTKNKQTTIQSLMQRIQILETNLDRHDKRHEILAKQYNQLFRHVSYLEAKLIQNDITFQRYTHRYDLIDEENRKSKNTPHDEPH